MVSPMYPPTASPSAKNDLRENCKTGSLNYGINVTNLASICRQYRRVGVALLCKRSVT